MTEEQEEEDSEIKHEKCC